MGALTPFFLDKWMKVAILMVLFVYSLTMDIFMRDKYYIQRNQESNLEDGLKITENATLGGSETEKFTEMGFRWTTLEK